MPKRNPIKARTNTRTMHITIPIENARELMESLARIKNPPKVADALRRAIREELFLLTDAAQE